MARPQPATSREPRADGLRNRSRLLDAARSAFLGSDARQPSLEAIARDAGVGIGTLYRHFPNRESLIAAVYEQELSSVTTTELTDELLARSPSAAAALRQWMNSYAGFVATKHGMSDALRAGAATGDIVAGRTRQQVSDTVGRFVAAGAEDGSLRSDLAAELITTALVGILWSAERTDSDQAGRLLDLLVDGLRPPSG